MSLHTYILPLIIWYTPFNVYYVGQEIPMEGYPAVTSNQSGLSGEKKSYEACQACQQLQHL